MNRFVCIHAHFYQPPRENPWLEEVELQDSAYPYHDWNKRIAAECYAPNTASRILGSNRRIIDIVNNYAKISFNFGPTLLSWMERHEPEIYSAVLQADRQSQEMFSGHGSALAQVYNHIIMPLANERDKRTQVIWGIKDFEHRFGRFPEGMWLAETAVDIPTLEVLAEYGIKFTILAPHQAGRVLKNGEEVELDCRMPYLCRLPSGKTITLFFYNGSITKEVAFGPLLKNGGDFASELMNCYAPEDHPQLVHIATDGETYGHHHRFGDMALAYCLYHIESNKLASITNYGQYLEKYPPSQEVEIVENSSWSCEHGVERWKSNCGCYAGGHEGWQQEWRTLLREAMDWLRDNVAKIYEEQMASLVSDPWKARDDYINVILDRSENHVEQFLLGQAGRNLSKEEKIKVLKLLEMQRHGLLMFTSCGWFFDEISSIEALKVMQYAARSMQLAKEITGIDLEPAYIKILERAPSNVKEYGDGRRVYEALVKPTVLDFLRVGAHYAISSIFEDYPETTGIYSYTCKSDVYDRIDMGKQKLVVGKANLHSDVVWEGENISFAVLHLGDHNLIGGVRPYSGEKAFELMHHEIKEAYAKSDVSKVILLMDKHFGTHNYSLWHLFKDEQRKILSQIVYDTLKDVEFSFRGIYERHYPVMQIMNEAEMPLPKALAATAELILNTDLRTLLESDEVEIDTDKLEKLADEIKRWSVELDTPMLSYVASEALSRLMKRFSMFSEDLPLLDSINTVIRIMNELSLNLDIWKAQNIYFNMSKEAYKNMAERADAGDEEAKKWVEGFKSLGNYLQVTSA